MTDSTPVLTLPDLPINEVLPSLRQALALGSAVLSAPPGSGKTTVVPLALLQEPWLAHKKILMLEPRRLATRAAARRMASLLGEPVGQQVGYQVRFERCSSAKTRIEVVTEGILTRRLQQDGALDDVGLVIFDEFHERSLHADLALALCLDLCQLREDLRLLVMSATLDTAPLAQLLGGVPVIVGEGRQFAVACSYLERPMEGRISAVTALGVRRMLQQHQGDLLVFLPGSGEIRETTHLLSEDPACTDCLILPLYGDLSPREQDRAILPDSRGQRRIILATAIAETSLTIEGVTCVVDSGFSRLPSFDAASGLSRLQTVRVSKATAEQRAGRAGRLGPGHCLRLWTASQHHSLPPFHPPEIVNADLAPLALELALWGVADAKALQWLDPPREGLFRQAVQLLQSLHAIDDRGRITAEGKKLAQLPLHPRLGQMLLRGQAQGLAGLACNVAALLAERDLLSQRERGAELGERLRVLQQWRREGDQSLRQRGLDAQLCRRIDQASRQWQQMLGCRDNQAGNPNDIGSLLIHAYPERIARRRPGQRERYQMAGGQGLRLLPIDPLAAYEYLVVAQADSGRGEGRIYLAEPIDLAEIVDKHAHLLSNEDEVAWDAATARVRAVRCTRLGAIVVEERPLEKVAEQPLLRAMLEGITQLGLDCLPWSREARQFQARIHTLRSWQPEAGWPDLHDEALLADLAWLEPFLAGINRAEQLARLNMQDILQAPLLWEQRQAVDRLAPPAITVPSGSHIRIDYRLDGPPILAVRLQEMFGLTSTPTVCSGRVPLLLHLLSPARRPIQVTSDLASFWQQGYPQVKKELKGRYPKHSWPDDPLVAPALRGVKPKPGKG